MKTRGSERLRPSGLSTRRFVFLTLLLLAVAAPAGMVFAGERKSPYIVVFRDEAVTQSVADSGSYFLRLVAPKTSGAPKTRVDVTRVHKHVAEIKARIRVNIDNVYASALGGFAANLTNAQVRALERDPAVEALVPDEDVTIDDGVSRVREAGGIRTTANPRTRVPAGIRRVGAQRNALARASGRGNRVNADVAVIDTGIERSHPDLNVVGGYNCTSRNRDRWDDADGHGTHVAGIIGAKDNNLGVVGVAPGVRLWSVKVLGPSGSGRISWLVCGIDWVTSQREKGNASRAKFEVANLSISFSLPRRLDGGCSSKMHDAVHQAICRSVKRGTVYVVAAGNESHNARQNRPAAYDEVITVSAMADYDGRGGGRAARDSCPYSTPERDDGFATFSNYGPDVDLIAPGRCVLSTYPRKRYAWMSGTSMASPHVAGAAAVYRAMYPKATPAQVRMGLRAVATRDWRTSTDPDKVHEKAVWIGNFRSMPDFAVANATGSSATKVLAGTTFRTDVTVRRTGGFEDPITVSLSEAPEGFRATAITTSSEDASVRVRVQAGVAPGRYQLTLVSSSSDVQHPVTVSVRVVSAQEAAALMTAEALTEGGL
jgi:subtilisin